ncbi:MAG TPA: xylulokinase [Candidatus Limnocylindrales bacterium]|nr:xylulokinase [Candidatus Limnocylindrales bacterium]
MPIGTLVAGVDSSTQATKVVVVDPDSGRLVAQGQARHTVTGSGGARESDPREWWSALRSALTETGRAGEIGAIAIAGQQHGLVALDEHGVPLREAPLWNDTRSAEDAERLTERLGAETWARLTGLRPVASFTVCKWAWLRRTEPDVARRVAAVRLPHDYLTERLTGRGTTDRGDASGTGWWSPFTGDYLGEILGLPEVELPPERLPAVLGPTDVAGTVTASAATELGLPAGTIVGPGTGDNMGAALGLGLSVGQAAMSLGTSGTIYAASERPAADPTGIVAGFADATGRFLPLAATLNCTVAVDRMAGWLGLDRDDVEPAGSVVVLPYLDGERTPNLPLASGTIRGLRHTSTPQQILMAAYEGAVASLLVAFDAIGEAVGGLDPAAPLLLIGGGARGRTWRSVVGRLTGRAIQVPEAGELVAIGAAVQATAVLRGEAPDAVAARWGSAAGTLLEPVPVDQDRLARIRDLLADITTEQEASRTG